MKIVIISAIGRMGPDAIEAIPPLGEILKVNELDIEEIKNQFNAGIYRSPQDKYKEEKSKEDLTLTEKVKMYFKNLINKVRNFFLLVKRIIITFIHDPLSIKASIQVQAARGLGRIGKDSNDALNFLRFGLYNPKKIVRREVLLALGSIGPSAANLNSEIIESLEDRNPDVRWRASEALGKIGVNTTEVTDALENLLYDKFDLVSESAEIALDNLKQIIT